MSRLRVGMLTTGFPRFEGDFFGTFVLELARELAGGGAAVEVLAPHEGGVATRETFGAVAVRRFRYFWPAKRQAVAYGGGIPTNVRTRWAARLQVPFFLLGFWWSAFKLVRRAQLVHCHWTLTGLGGLLAGRAGCVGRLPTPVSQFSCSYANLLWLQNGGLLILSLIHI